MGYTSRWRIYKVNPQTWADADEIKGFKSASVSRESGNLIESGSIVIDHGEELDECYVRIAMVASHDGANERIDVATLLCITSGGDWSGSTATIDGRSVLRPASTALYDYGAYCPPNVDAVQWSARELEKVLQAPVSYEGSFTLAKPMVFDLGASVLDSVRKVLESGGYTITINGYGEVFVIPLPKEPVTTIDASNARLLMVGGETTRDYSDIPNRYTARNGKNVARAVNDSIDSPVSTVSRGYRVDVLDTSPVPTGGETLQGYDERRLYELSTVSVEETYTREWIDGINVDSVVRLGFGDTGDYRVTAQDYECGEGITVTEKVTKEVALWTR